MRRAVLAVVVVICGCGGVPTAEPAQSTAPATVPSSTTQESTTTIAPSTSTTLEATTTTVAARPDWTPACVPLTGGPTPTAGPYRDAALDRFGPLEAHPSLDVTLPNGAPNMTNPAEEPPFVQPVRVEGGVLLALSANDYSSAKSSIVAVVNTDGSKRWVRCIEGRVVGVWAAAPSTQPKTATLAILTSVANNTFTYDWPIVSLADGTTQGTLSDAAVQAGISASDFAHYAVYPADPWPRATGALLTDSVVGDYRTFSHLVRYDAIAGTLTPIPVPTELQTSTEVSLGLDAVGEPIVSDTYAVGGYQRVLTVYAGGVWTHDPTVLRRAIGVRPFLGDPAQLAGALIGVDATGAIAWSAAPLTSPQIQSMSVKTDGLTVVATVCTEGTADPCSAALVGVDLATGRRLWSLPGLRSVAALSNGYVLTSEAPLPDLYDGTASQPGWMLLNARTGRIADASQHWADPDEFLIGCCGDSGLITVYQLGGMVIAIHYTTLHVWLPKGVGGSTQSVSIP